MKPAVEPHVFCAYRERGDWDAELEYPECYLLVRHERSGEEWIMPISGRMILDIEKRVKHWLKRQFGGELAFEGKVWKGGSGLAEYSASIITDGRPPSSNVVWTSCGFWVKATY